MKGFFILALGLLVVLTGSVSQAQNATLDSLIRVVLDNNPDIKAAGHEYQAARYQVKTAGKLPDPMLGLGAMNLPASSLSFNESPMSELMLEFSQTIPWPGKLRKENQLARFYADQKKIRLSARESNIVRMVTSGYYEYVYWKKVREIIAYNLRLVQSLVEVAGVRYANGLGTGQDYLQAVTALARLENRQLQVERMIYSALLFLNRLAGGRVSVDTALPAMLDEHIMVMDIPGVDSIRIINPVLAEAAVTARMTEESAALARLQYWPDFTISLGYGVRYDVPGDPMSGEDMISFKVGISLPLWFGVKRNAVRAAGEQLLMAVQQERALELQIEQLIKDIREQLITIKASYQRYNEVIVPRTRAAFDAAGIAYEVGQIDFNALLSTQTEFLEVVLERLRLIYDFHNRLAEYRELTGEKNNR
ncbi:MAG: TolC family protein [candidate division Zixibacteria bacterium]|nr:TolC family protein [candidate division Zixibacteria bacterium]MDD5425351.1 TolC family protein [candidate division Zixibacteria bacterium]